MADVVVRNVFDDPPKKEISIHAKNNALYHVAQTEDQMWRVIERTLDSNTGKVDDHPLSDLTFKTWKQAVETGETMFGNAFKRDIHEARIEQPKIIASS